MIPGAIMHINGKWRLILNNEQNSGIIIQDTANDPDTYHMSNALLKKIHNIPDIIPEIVIPNLIFLIVLLLADVNKGKISFPIVHPDINRKLSIVDITTDIIDIIKRPLIKRGSIFNVNSR